MVERLEQGRSATEASVPGARARIGPEERERIERENRRLLEHDLSTQSLAFASRPYMADLQYSNFCNMSCTMCYDGDNPKLKRMSPELLRRIEAQVCPSLSVINPYGGSEPLILTWDETRRMARENGVLLDVTTNIQYLDETRFHELKDITQTLLLSLESHIPEVYARIRLKADTKKVFANLPVIARLSREHRVECIVNVIFMVENADHLHETIRWLAETGFPSVNLIQLIDFNGHSAHSDPFQNLSPERVEEVKRRCISAAKEARVRLVWSVRGLEVHDHRPEAGRVPPNPRKAEFDQWIWRTKHHFPGYCKQSHSRIKIDATGRIYPCCNGEDGELLLGSLLEQPFEEIWNGPTSRDLRRGMLTWDVPALCQGCRFRDRLPVERHLPFVDHVRAQLQQYFGVQREVLGLELAGPEHMTRQTDAPRIRILPPAQELAGYLLVLALGGESAHVEHHIFEGNATELQVPEGLWRRLRPNMGYWWTVWGAPRERGQPALRAAEIRCLIRHSAIPRVAGSTLRYSDQGHTAARYLGGQSRPPLT